jgi:hypothetical protein
MFYYNILAGIVHGGDSPISAPIQLRSNVPAETSMSATNATMPVIVLPSNQISFAQSMNALPWNEFAEAIRIGEIEKREHLLDLITGELIPWIIKEPLQPESEIIRTPPVLDSVKTEDCTHHPNAFTGILRSRPARIAHLVSFGFEADVLEIHINEIYDVVDYIFVCESTRAHHKNKRKHLVWELLRLQPRFARFQSKLVHLVIDDADSAVPASVTDIWYLERWQERLRFEKFVDWNSKQAVPFQDDDLVGFGDADEVASRKNFHLLKHCQIKPGMIDVGIWFAIGSLEYAFRTDFPIPGHPYTLGDPSFISISGAKTARTQGQYISRTRGSAGSYLLGGMHMTTAPYLPFVIMKGFVCTECGLSVEGVMTTANVLKSGTVVEMTNHFISLSYSYSTGRNVKITDMDPNEANQIVSVPWFLKNNPSRYPYWIKQPDTRLM